MEKKIFLISVILAGFLSLFLCGNFLFFVPFAKADVITFCLKDYGEDGHTTTFNSVQQTPDEGYIAVGHTSDGPGDSYIYLVKTDKYGDIEYEKTFKDPLSSGVFGYSVEQASDGGYIVAGRTFNITPSSSKVYVVKTDSTLDSTTAGQWEKTYAYIAGMTSHVVNYGNSVQQTSPDGGYIITGHTESSIGGTAGVYLLKIKEDGTKEWERFRKVASGIDTKASSVEQTTGGYIVAGRTWDGIGSNAFLMKFDSGGGDSWEERYPGTPAASNTGEDVKQITGGYIVAGAIMNGPNNDFHIIKTDLTGTILWEKTYGTPGFADQANSVQQTSDGGYIIAGLRSLKDAYLVKTDSTGTIIWEKGYGDIGISQIAREIQQTSDNGYIVAGDASLDGKNRAVLMKLDENGDCSDGVHSECDYVEKKCVEMDGEGTDECTIDSECITGTACPAECSCSSLDCEGGIVPCGRTCDDPDTSLCECCPCGFCHAFVLVKKITDFLIGVIIFPLLVLMAIAGGVYMITAGGSQERITKGKEIIKTAVIAVLIVLVSWVVINSLMFLFTGSETGGVADIFGTPWSEIECPVP